MSAARTARTGHVVGRVQGVGFRWSARHAARRIGVGGWVQNLPDGRVAFAAEGGAREVEAFLDWLREGPPAARVEGLHSQPCPPEGLDSFEIR